MPKKREPTPTPVDGTPAPASAVAKELGVALAVIYGMVKRGDVKNHLAGGWPTGKGLEVDIAEVRAARGSKKTRAPKTRTPKTVKVKDPDSGETVTVSTKARKLPQGTIVSYDKGRGAGVAANSPAAKPRYSVAQVLAATGRLTFMDDGDHRRTYNGTQIDNTVFSTDRLSLLMAKGVVRIEHPVPVLGMVILSLIMDEKIELAQSLENWMIKNDLQVRIPEIMELEDESYEPQVGRMVEEDELSGDE